jgi:hypothetical protein
MSDDREVERQMEDEETESGPDVQVNTEGGAATVETGDSGDEDDGS